MPVLAGIIGITLTVLVASLGFVPGLTQRDYEREAVSQGRAAFFQSGSVPGSVDAFGRSIATAPLAEQIYARDVAIEDRTSARSRKSVVEQAIVNICVNLQARCNTQDVSKIWAFLPNTSGPVTEILTGTTSSTLNCGTATPADFGNYGRYLLQGRLAAGDLSSVTIRSNTGAVTATLGFFYGRPSGGTGCGFEDIVELR